MTPRPTTAPAHPRRTASWSRAVVIVCCIAVTSCAAPSRSVTEDTPENRRQAAEQYLRVVPPENLMRDTADRVAETLPEEARDRFKRAMTQELDMTRLSAAMVDSMVHHFTVAEIDALARFYGSPAGKSVMQKFGLYMADIMPVIQAETRKALSKARATP
jgi:hypothetical protein